MGMHAKTGYIAHAGQHPVSKQDLDILIFPPHHPRLYSSSYLKDPVKCCMDAISEPLFPMSIIC
ncbi:hypothetical protein D6D10_09892 [Aureobasidium pullulans]|uniref:Uncharacterized protein n=1 Tax=Aureobasidium pullulans TaxID=5580 RepID=A0A4S9DX59_AURPU|nr:hypothetical protein D6D10_09892 [Aureobasidium pullulans]